MKNSCHKVGVNPLLHCSSTAFQSRSFHWKIFQQDFVVFIFFAHPLAPMNGLAVCGLIYLVYLFFSYLSHAFIFFDETCVTVYLIYMYPLQAK